MSATVGAVFGRIGKQIDTLGGSLARLKKQSGDIAKLQAAQGKLAEAKAKGSATAVKRYSDQVARLSKSLEEAGVDTSKLTQEQARLAAAIASSSARMSAMTRIGENMNRIRAAATGVGSAFSNVKMHVMGLTTKLGLLGASAGYVFKTQFVDTAAEFERLQTILTTLEGGNVTKAKQAFGWISNFAAKTPYDIKQVSEAFVRLRAYGIDPISGDTLRVLGDTASSMGKDVMDAVEAIADAVTGENERLKEFGIKAAKDGGRIVYNYTDRAGKQRQKAVDAGNRKLIQSTLTAIWNEKYAGAMDAQSRTWNGMISNLSDQWTRFTTTVMAEGVFDWMKSEVGGILEELNKAAADGRLKEWAKQTGKAIKEAFVTIKDFGIEAKNAIVAMKDFVGGWQNLGIALGAVMLAPTIASVASLTKAMWALGLAIYGAIGPIGLVAFGLGIIATALWNNQEAIENYLRESEIMRTAFLGMTTTLETLGNVWDSIVETIEEGGAAWVNIFNSVIKTVDDLIAKVRNLFALNIGGFSLGDIGGKLLDINPLTALPRLGQRAMEAVMPAEQMPAAGGIGTVNNNVNVKIDAPNANGPEIERHLRSSLPKRPLYDVTGALVPQ